MLKRVGGFVLAMGGTNDHVAITLRQAGKPCLIAGEQYRQPQDRSTVTLVAGNFQGTEGACIVPGDQAAEWLACRTTLSQDYEPALNRSKQYQPVHPSFQRPQDGFAWLSQQNDRLLNYFSTNRLFHQCLSPEQSKLLSMSGHRAEVARQLQTEVDYFCEDADALLQGYQQFLNLAGETEDTTVVDYRNELPVLRDKLHPLTANIKRMAADISSALLDNRETQKISGYSEWLAQCQALKSTLQDLNQPADAATINSLHDFIFLVHKRFVDGLGPVAEHSGQGKVIGFGHKKNQGKWLDFISTGDAGLLNPDIRDALKAFDGEVTILNLPTAFRLNARLGMHVCEVGMFEQAEGGKGRKIKLTLSDNFSSGHASGKYQRCFFLVSGLLAEGMDRNRMTLNFDRATGKLSLDYAPIGSQEDMQRFYALSVSLLGTMRNLDITFNDNPKWNFESLETRLNQPDWDIESFIRLILSVRVNNKPYYHRLDKVYHKLNELQQCICRLTDEELSTANDLLFNAYQEFKEQGRESEYRAFIRAMVDQYSDSVFPLLTPYPQLMAWLNQDEIPIRYAGSAAGDNKQLVINALSRGEKDTFKHISERLLNDRTFILELIEQYPQAMSGIANINVWLKKWSDDQELLIAALRKKACGYWQLEEKWKNNKPFVLALAASGVCIGNVADDIRYDRDVFMVRNSWYGLSHAPEAFKSDREVVLAVVSSDGLDLKYASQALKKDREVVLAACRSNSYALNYASDELKNDKALVLEVVSRTGAALEYASEALKNDPDVFIAALRQDYEAFKYAGADWKQNREAVLAVVRQHGYYLRNVADAFKQDAEIVSAAMENHTFAFHFAGDRFKDNEEYVRKAITQRTSNMEYASDRYRGNKQFVSEVIRQHGGNILEYVNDELKNDPQVVLTALKHWDGRGKCPMEYASQDLRKTPDFVTAAVKIKPEAFKSSSYDLRSDINFIKQLLDIDNRVLQYADYDLRDNKELLRLRDMKNPLGIALE
ncbi:DUF4116 domain-containing protein [Endozoicomonas ascidiicola]|uniref:DUF4116 domain-containing protein n=1 Tax=Endozoicomonas ascidiicola TaxID=1698521 RepID=UPI0020A35478|nr:DUF4116 domain-containing protein [Endozoicomonas ascidiicola]